MPITLQQTQVLGHFIFHLLPLAYSVPVDYSLIRKLPSCRSQRLAMVALLDFTVLRQYLQLEVFAEILVLILVILLFDFRRVLMVALLITLLEVGRLLGIQLRQTR